MRSTERFLTTHTGSLPRPDDLIRMMYAKEEGVPVDPAALAARVRVGGRGGRAQAGEAGIDLVNDGEMTQAELRDLHQGPADGLRRHRATRSSTRISRSSPSSRKRVFGDPGRSRRKTPACNAPITRARRGRGDQPTSSTCRRRSRTSRRAGGFLTAASPGVVSLFFRNDHYPSQEAYLDAIAEAMRHEYETIADAGFALQIDCPDLGMGRHIQYADLSLAEFRKRARAPRRGAQPRAAQHSRRAAAHAPVLGQLRRAAPLRRAARRRHRHRACRRSRRRSRSRRPTRGTRTSGSCSSGEAARRQGADPRRDRIEVELHRAPRAGRAAHRALRQPRRPRERDRRQRLRLRHLGRAGGRRSGRRVGEARRDGRGRAARDARSSGGDG